ncbi:ankyrin repeat-containing protein-like protein [Salvia divinorum]|uniref:Ankyrin repeat-containing protein-like protein n=1 Tax=Salvia divinorum TaxID=28513 RepID=A0ABD1HR92_SALDI
MVSEVVERKLYETASRGDVATLVRLLEDDPYLVHGVSFPCSRNLLHIAAMHGQTSIVEAVANLDPQLAWSLDSQQLSPLHIAAMKGHVEICQKLLSVAPEACWWRDCHDMNPVHIAAMKGHVEVLESLFQESLSPAMERVHRRETVLHLCVKHGQLRTLKVLIEKLGEELVHATNEDGETIMHLAVRFNQFETIQYLVENIEIKSQTFNSMGKTEVQILNDSPWNITTSYSEIKRVLSSLKAPPIHNMKLADSMMMLTASIAFQNTMNPPGGVWQDDTPSHKAGEAVIAYTHGHIYDHLVEMNAITLCSSLIAMTVNTNGKSDICASRVGWSAMHLAIVAFMLCYLTSIVVISPDTIEKSFELALYADVVLLRIWYFYIGYRGIFIPLRMWYFIWKRKIRRGEDLTTDPLHIRILYRIFQSLETCMLQRLETWWLCWGPIVNFLF